MVKPLIDADMLRYEVGFGVEFKDTAGEIEVNSFDSAIELLEKKVREIKEETWADEDPVFYLTADEKLINQLNKRRKEPLLFKPNFREALAVTKPYKGNRLTSKKPFHYHNLTHYILATYETKLAIGIEADDLLSIDHRLNPDSSIICSRDKDLKITPGSHYGWACGRSPSFGPRVIDELGYLDPPVKGKLKGGGLKFFYAQMLMGDTTDNIPGIKGRGPAFAYKVLNDLDNEGLLFGTVADEYREVYPTSWRERFQEMANLLWMVQELDQEGNPILYKMFDERN